MTGDSVGRTHQHHVDARDIHALVEYVDGADDLQVAAAKPIEALIARRRRLVAMHRDRLDPVLPKKPRHEVRVLNRAAKRQHATLPRLPLGLVPILVQHLPRARVGLFGELGQLKATVLPRARAGRGKLNIRCPSFALEGWS